MQSKENCQTSIIFSHKVKNFLAYKVINFQGLCLPMHVSLPPSSAQLLVGVRIFFSEILAFPPPLFCGLSSSRCGFYREVCIKSLSGFLLCVPFSAVCSNPIVLNVTAQNGLCGADRPCILIEVAISVSRDSPQPGARRLFFSTVTL